MKCPECNAWTEVLETKMRDRGYKYRRYLCANGHRFSSKEVVTKFPPSGLSRPIGVNPFAHRDKKPEPND